MIYEITKLDAVKFQLDTAIELFFLEKDVISCHTLIGASRNILVDIAKYKKISCGLRSLIKPKLVNQFESIVRKNQNFLKHADKDIEESLTFDSEVTMHLLIDAINMYSKLTDNNDTKNMQTFYIYFMSHYPKFLMEQPKQKILEIISQYGVLDKKRIWTLSQSGL